MVVTIINHKISIKSITGCPFQCFWPSPTTKYRSKASSDALFNASNHHQPQNIDDYDDILMICCRLWLFIDDILVIMMIIDDILMFMMIYGWYIVIYEWLWWYMWIYWWLWWFMDDMLMMGDYDIHNECKDV